MSALGKHLRSRVYTLEARVRRGLVMRHEKTWSAEPGWCERHRFHHGIRATIAKLRKARAYLAEYRQLRGAA